MALSIFGSMRITLFIKFDYLFFQGQTDQLNAKIVELEKQLESKQEMELENQQLQEKLDVMEHMEGEFLKMVADLHINVAEKERALQALEEYSQALTVKERESNDELQKTRKRMIEVSFFRFLKR